MLIAGNWKMNMDVTSAGRLAGEVVRSVRGIDDVMVAVCPPSVCLDAVFRVVQGTSVRLGAQNMHHADSGAYTGEVSAAMLRSVGCSHVILGHSERRQYFGESDESVNAKVSKGLQNKLVPIVCVGEVLSEREAGDEQRVVRRQLDGALAGIDLEDASEIVIAYEPVWAIGTGRTASPEQAQEMHAFIRGLLVDRFGGEVGTAIHILYGGSMKPDNALDLLSQTDVDGGLIGGASLDAASFASITEAGQISLR